MNEIFWNTIFIFRCSTSAIQCTTTTASWIGWISTALFVEREPCLISRPSPATTPRTPSPARSQPVCTDPWSSARSQTPTTKIFEVIENYLKITDRPCPRSSQSTKLQRRYSSDLRQWIVAVSDASSSTPVFTFYNQILLAKTLKLYATV